MPKKIYLSSYFAEMFWPRWAKLTGCQVANNGPLTSANTHFTSQKGVKRPQHRSKKGLKGQHMIHNTQNTQHKQPFHIPKRG